MNFRLLSTRSTCSAACPPLAPCLHHSLTLRTPDPSVHRMHDHPLPWSAHLRDPRHPGAERRRGCHWCLPLTAVGRVLCSDELSGLIHTQNTEVQGLVIQARQQCEQTINLHVAHLQLLGGNVNMGPCRYSNRPTVARPESSTLPTRLLCTRRQHC